MGGVEQLAERLQVVRAAARSRPRARAAFSSSTWLARRAQRRAGSRATAARRPPRAATPRPAAGTLARTRRVARCSRSSRAAWRSPESSTTSRQPPRRSGTGSTCSVRKSMQQRGVGRAVERGELVEQAGVRAHPVVLHARAQPGELDRDRARRRAGRSRVRARSARGTARPRAPPRRTGPRRAAASPLISQARADEREARARELGDGRRARTRASRPRGGGSPSANSSLLVEVAARSASTRAGARVAARPARAVGAAP